MSKLKILNKKEIQNILDILDKQFGYKGKLDYVFLQSEKNKVYIVNKDIDKIDLSKLRVNSYGLYILELRDNVIRLSVDGSQLIGPNATKNILELDDKTARDWLKGTDIDYNGDLKGFVIIKNQKDFLGCGKVVEGKVLNYVPKIRRLNCKD